MDPTLARDLSYWPNLDRRVFGVGPNEWVPAGGRVTPIPRLTQSPSGRDAPREDLVSPLLWLIPTEIKRALSPLPAGLQWRSLQLVAAVPEALELFVTNPTLAGWLAEIAQVGYQPEVGARLARLALRGPRHKTLPMLGLPPRRGLVRILAKIDPLALADPGLEALRGLLLSTDKRVRRCLQHLPLLGVDSLQVLAEPACIAISKFSLLRDRGRDDLSRVMDLRGSLTFIAEARDDGRAPRKPARFGSRAEVVTACRAVEPTDRRARRRESL